MHRHLHAHDAQWRDEPYPGLLDRRERSRVAAALLRRWRRATGVGAAVILSPMIAAAPAYLAQIW